jgi:hypothetical protein
MEIQLCPDVSIEERSSHAIVKSILKLRWIGRKDEAEQMLVSLLRSPSALGFVRSLNTPNGG